MLSGEISSFPGRILMQSVQLTSAEQSNYQVSSIQCNAEEPNNQIQVNINVYTFRTWIQKEVRRQRKTVREDRGPRAIQQLRSRSVGWLKRSSSQAHTESFHLEKRTFLCCLTEYLVMGVV